jgi:hypothetical protein
LHSRFFLPTRRGASSARSCLSLSGKPFGFLVLETVKLSVVHTQTNSYPFDVGDRVNIDLTGTSMYVQKIHLLSTTVS